MNSMWPVFFVFLFIGLTVWAFWPIVTGRAPAPWDDDEEDGQ
jgi:hypothetical protein